jgi:hypothetical protein
MAKASTIRIDEFSSSQAARRQSPTFRLLLTAPGAWHSPAIPVLCPPLPDRDFIASRSARCFEAHAGSCGGRREADGARLQLLAKAAGPRQGFSSTLRQALDGLRHRSAPPRASRGSALCVVPTHLFEAIQSKKCRWSPAASQLYRDRHQLNPEGLADIIIMATGLNV